MEEIPAKTPSGCLKLVVPKPIYTMFSLHISMIKFNLQVKHNKRLITISNNKIEQLQQYIVIKVTWMWLLFQNLTVPYSYFFDVRWCLHDMMKWDEWHRQCNTGLDYYWPSHHVSLNHLRLCCNQVLHQQTASSVIFIFFNSNLFLALCKHSLLPVNG